MYQTTNVAPFVGAVLQRNSAPVSGRWNTLADDAPIAVPAARRQPGEKPLLALNTVRALAGLVDGSAKVRFVSQSDPALVAEVTVQGSTETLVYRTRSEQIYSTAQMNQSPAAAVNFAARLLVNRVADLSAAYAALLGGIAAKADQPVLDGLMATCADELMVSCAEDLGLDEVPPQTTWFRAVKVSAETPEVEDASALDLTPLFTDPVMFGKYLAGEPTPFTTVEKVQGTVPVAASAPVDIKADAFIGPQRAIIVKYAAQNKNILYFGPTGTGKSFLWEIAMRDMDPDFDADNYPYFVHGSGGLEDIDFVGQAILDENGDRHWVNGPLTRAMLDGKRFKCEEMNRLPGSMLNVLLGAMDFGRIFIPALGRMVVAQPGFAVDAMANIGREYTATEEIDPAVMRRFQIKVEFDFLPADQEVKLLRSRHAGLKAEDAETLVRIANTIRQAHEEGSGSVDVDLYVSPAALLNSAELVASGLGIIEAIKLTWLADVAWTKAKRENVLAAVELHIRQKKSVRGRKV